MNSPTPMHSASKDALCATTSALHINLGENVMNPCRSYFSIGDYVTFHTKRGATTGIIEVILLHNPQTALITVRMTFSGKPKRYMRPLYKLKHADLA